MQRTLVVMLKTPRPGRVKTRLGRDIGMTSAAWWFRHQALSLLTRVRDRRWQTVLAVTPDPDAVQNRVWPADLPRIPQGSGNLGDRMARIFRTMPPGPVCIVGADIPDLTQHNIDRAFRALGRDDAVVGPATDGGYWLIGLKRLQPHPPGMFKNVRWSTEHALKDTLATIPNFSTARIETLRDVDTVADLRRR